MCFWRASVTPIIDVTHVSTPAEGVKITFQRRQNNRKRFIISKPICPAENSAFLRWCAARGPGLSLLKAASFLMHGDGFAGVRNFLLQHSRVIIQDDSGIPLRMFPKGWKVNCYGRYVPHHEEFEKYHQPILLRSSRKTRRLRRSVLLSAIIGKKMTAF